MLTKNISFVCIFLMISMFVVSCKKDNNQLIEGIWTLKSKKKECLNKDNNTSSNLICKSLACEEGFLCSREVYTLFNGGEVNKFTCSSFFGLTSDNTYEGDYTLEDKRLTICIEKPLETECKRYVCKLLNNKKMKLERTLEDGCVEASEYERE